jgi:protein-S-isoprenylcysteine O-methyltransferase Ste14
MANSAINSNPFTQLKAINLAKGLTIFLLIGYGIIFGIHDMRQVIYLCLHISYCVWWLIEQWFYPKRQQMMFSDSVGIVEIIFALLIVGVFYSLPGFLAFMNSEPISFLTVGLALPLFFFGSIVNATADVQKLTAKELGAGLVQDNIWRFSRNINYFGDLLRYLSFAVVAGSIWAYLVPGLVFVIYLQRIFQKEKSMGEKYSEYQEYKNKTSRLIPLLW